MIIAIRALICFILSSESKKRNSCKERTEREGALFFHPHLIISLGSLGPTTRYTARRRRFDSVDNFEYTWLPWKRSKSSNVGLGITSPNKWTAPSDLTARATPSSFQSLNLIEFLVRSSPKALLGSYSGNTT